ncbi:NUDIX hydrolase [Blastochloris tepida]|uniref:NUDIX hydrolase n=2 Tax=Blastochloris tepida TaxID=2233851 RepID=A0A348FZQ0_9HYPH|nr:NUDIX hydrolase [Blastochloris tepida]
MRCRISGALRIETGRRVTQGGIDMSKRKRRALSTQVAALPVRRASDGRLEVLLVTSRETRRWIIPKGWPIKGVPNHIAAAHEAREEAGLLGCVRKGRIGRYQAWKRLHDSFELVEVDVYRFDVDSQFDTWPEKGQRSFRWVDLKAAADLVDEPGLAKLLHELAGNEDVFAD